MVSRDGRILTRRVVLCGEFSEALRDVVDEFHPETILLGSSTGSKAIGAAIRKGVNMEPKLVDEKHTTELAKVRYFQEFPPRGFWKLVPVGLQTPATCYDDFAAVVMAERFLGIGIDCPRIKEGMSG